MGFLGGLFGSKKEYPPLDEQDPAAKKLEEHQEPLNTLAGQIRDPMEIVPGDRSVYVLIGKPPKEFGVAWIEDGEVHNFKKLLTEKGVSPGKLESIVTDLREAYVRNESEPRYSAKIGGRNVLVTPSPRLGQEVSSIIQGIAS